MATLPLLKSPDDYVARTIDILTHDQNRTYWLGLFRRQWISLLQHAVRSEAASDTVHERCGQAKQEFLEFLDAVEQTPDLHGDLTVPFICEVREQILRRAGFADPYKPVKIEENQSCLELLPQVLRELDAQPDDSRLQALIEGVFAGNIFDLGAAKTTEMYENGELDFRSARSKLPDRPWLVDDLDLLNERFAGPAHHKAMLFVDNAGADVVLGMIPLGRELLKRGSQVVLTANTTPALNDIIHDELVKLIQVIAGFDEVVANGLADGKLKLVPSGNGIPLIDFKRVGDDIANEAKDVDLLIIEGMGRALESNYHTQFTCESLKLAIIKEPHVAEVFGGNMYDVVCRYEQ